MSKRHQASRRKTYGRRQHEVRERQDRAQHAEGFDFELGDWGSDARPTRSASSIRAVRASASCSATERWPSTRVHVLGSSGCRCVRGSSPARRCARRRVRGAFRAGRRTNRLGIVLGGIVVAFMLAFFSLAQEVRVSATGLDIGRLQVERQRLDAPGRGARFGREPARSRAGDPQARDRCRPRPARRAHRPASPLIDRGTRCWAEPTRAAACSSCSSSSSSARWRSAARLGLLAGRRSGASRRRGPGADDGHGRDRQQARRHLRPERDGRPGHLARSESDSSPRPTCITADKRAATRHGADAGSSGSTRRQAPRCATSSPRRASTSSSTTASSGPQADQIRAADRRTPGLRAVARIGARAGLSAGRRRSQDDARGEPPRLRQPGRRRPVRRGAGVAVDARRHARDRRRRSRRQRPARDGHRQRHPGRRGRHGRAPDHRCRPPAARRAGAVRRLGRRPGEADLGRRHRPVQRRDLRRGELSVVRRERLQGDRGDEPVALHRPGRVERLRAGLGLQDDDRGGRPREEDASPP